VSPFGSAGSSVWVVRGGVVSSCSPQLGASIRKESNLTSAGVPPLSCLTNMPTLVTPFGPYWSAGTGGAIAAHASPSTEYSVMTSVPS
jgi:hypothetical protein